MFNACLTRLQVLSLGEDQVFVPTQPNDFLPRLERECIELVFSDGRTLVCTADHQIKTHDGWLRADQLVPCKSQVILGIEAPLYDPREDDELHLAKFELQLVSTGVW